MENKNKIMLFSIICFILFACFFVNLINEDMFNSDEKTEIDNDIKIENNEQITNKPSVDAEIKKGISGKKTRLTNKKFYAKDNGNNSLKTFEKADEYGKSSSQDYQIIPFSNEKTNRNEGYEVKFTN